MEYITNLNRERNEKIIIQARELNSLFLINNIKPIFLKGTANLLAGIYEDISERMVGDIDFIFSSEDYPIAIKLLRNFDYSEVYKYDYYLPGGKHYRRLHKENSIAAVEIHSEIFETEKYREEFNYGFLVKDFQIIDEVRILSYANKLNLSIISYQINDNGFYYKTIDLRNAYDVFLLSKTTNVKDAINSLDRLKNPLNCFLAACYEIFGKLDNLKYYDTKMAASYLNVFNSQFSNPKSMKRRHKLVKIYLFLKSRINILYKSLIYQEYRVWLFKRLTDKNWHQEKLSIIKKQFSLQNNN
tara:strand:- start:31043 stop:31942 length:900 start_codon:yes stop_codon:yes gene_type:complete